MKWIYRVHERTSAGHTFYSDYKTKKHARLAMERFRDQGTFNGVSCYTTQRWIKVNGMYFVEYDNYIPCFQL